MCVPYYFVIIQYTNFVSRFYLTSGLSIKKFVFNCDFSSKNFINLIIYVRDFFKKIKSVYKKLYMYKS